MKLIDADKLIEDIYSNAYACNDDEVNEILRKQLECNIEVINNQPTAYDVDKVIKELESLVEDREEDIINDEYTFGECSAYESAIRVVKAGGGDEI